jgi:hypothetical protein
MVVAAAAGFGRAPIAATPPAAAMPVRTRRRDSDESCESLSAASSEPLFGFIGDTSLLASMVPAVHGGRRSLDWPEACRTARKGRMRRWPLAARAPRCECAT